MLGEDRYGIYTGDEGSTHLAIVRFTPESGAEEIGEPITYPRISSPDIYRDAGTDTLYMATPVRLAPDGSYAEPLQDVPLPGPMVLYRFTPGSGYLPTDQTLPYRGQLRSIESNDVAWIEPKRAELCTSAPTQPTLCHPLPPSVRPSESWQQSSPASL